ncbi:MAG: MBL fold metallo-hydrolase [Firmicutes bacterium]|nr:MBL fold metallo-hydrolase [Bacillota bacterium]
MKALIYHLYHSGVFLEIDDTVLIFDYYYDIPVPGREGLEAGVVDTACLKGKRVYVFVTHRHSDHYNPLIFDWQKRVKGIKYILSNDIKIKSRGHNMIFMEKYQERIIDDIKVRTYGTTDQGLSYFLEVKDLNIYHAGDLNWWKWPGFSIEKQLQEERDFKNEVARIKDEVIDIAFIPVDPRLGENYYLAGKYFAQSLEPELLVPIHFGDNYQITDKFAAIMADTAVDSAVLAGRGSKIVFTKEN